MTARRVLLLAVACAACHKREESNAAPQIELTDAQRRELDATIAQSRKAIDALDAPWQPAIAAIDPRTLGDDAEPCHALDWAISGLLGNPQSSDWGSWQVDAPLGFKGGSSASFSHAPFPVSFYKAGDPTPRSSPEAAAVVVKLDRLAHGDLGTRPFEERKERATVAELRTTDVLVRLDQVVEPELAAGDRFVAGALEASVWAFDHQQNVVVCAGVVRAGSSDTVDPGSSNLDDDMMINFMRALPAALREPT